MMEKQSIRDMLPAFFEGTLDSENQQKVEEWITESDKNKAVFIEMQQVWEQTGLLRRMQKYNAQKALENVNRKISHQSSTRFLHLFQKIAAILVLPLLIATLHFSTKNSTKNYIENDWYTLKTGAGMRSEFILPDGTNVFLNSNTTLSYPVAFYGDTREVKLQGEAYFDVAKNIEQPFVLNTGILQVEVTGTEFAASNYINDNLTEIVLVEGSINLCECDNSGKRNTIQSMIPGDKATFVESENKLYSEKVEVAKYIAWKDGVLMFRDDSMEEVVRRLNHWFNVDITLSVPTLDYYVYTATFKDESLIQVLDLLKMSAPIDYKIKQRKRNSDNTFTKMEIEIIQK